MVSACLCDSVVVAPSFLEKMRDHARKTAPLECCGVLGGRGSVVTSVYLLSNDLHSPSEFLAKPEELFNAIRSMRKKNEDMIGIFHSHPNSPPTPSPADLERNYYPGLFYFIISLATGEPQTRCYIMDEDRTVSSIQII